MKLEEGVYRSHLQGLWQLGPFHCPSRRQKMEEVIAGLQGFTFAFEQDVELQKGTGLLPFQGMDSE